MPRPDQERINQTLKDMREQPLGGDIRALKGHWRGSLRRGVGDWRVFFHLDAAKRLVIIQAIERRSSTTY
ncbi:MAG: type II toxin-antitoxin system RelE/ParE family toxin [Alphaproteobacteria bacterium]|nr:type II toxin-antitoxin system RelE/ParE family toxin [Alphaproteobacteria bacterium]